MIQHRYHLCLVLLVALLPAVALQAQDDRLRLVAYNMENFFDVFDDPYTADDSTEVKPRDEIESIAAVLRELDADVVAISEVENRGVLQAVVNEFLGDMGYRHVAVNPTNDGRGINLGVISRHPIDAITSYRFRELELPGEERTWRFARDLLRVTIELPGEKKLEVFTVHFKSKRDSAGDPDSAKWRLAEATETAEIVGNVMKLHPDRWVALAGDFNDTPDSPPIRALTQDLLIDAHAKLRPDKRITYLREPYRSTIDYILVNPPMGQAMTTAVIPTNERLLAGSDHAPVVADFQLPE
ncbi:MAG: endonuclease/exonuclease/phosphatase family protein [Phycisphaeraceae bacterium]